MENEIFMMIGSKYGDLRSSEKKAADYILAHMEEVRRMPLDRLAKECGVSQPTVDTVFVGRIKHIRPLIKLQPPASLSYVG